MFRIAVCDDEKIDRKVILSMIEKYVSAYNVENSIEEYDSADGLISGIAGKEGPDILFLDIFMSGMNGIELAKKLRSEHVKSDIVFITSSNEYAADAFEVNAFSYLRKPLEESKFDEIMDKIMNRYSRTRSIEVNCERVQEKIYVSDIIYIETSGRQLIIHTAASDYSVYMSIAGILKMLPRSGFVGENAGAQRIGRQPAGGQFQTISAALMAEAKIGRSNVVARAVYDERQTQAEN